MAGPARPRVGRHCRDAADGSLGNVACDGSKPIKGALAHPVHQRVDEIGDVRCAFLDEGIDDLSALKRLGDARGERHHLDAKAGFDGLDPVAEQTRQALNVADRRCHADPDGLGAAVDAVADEVKSASAQAAGLETLAELADELGDIPGYGAR